MATEITILVILFVLVLFLSAPFSIKSRLLIWGVVIVWVVGMMSAHSWIAARDPQALLRDSSTDVGNYYEAGLSYQDDYSLSKITSTESTGHYGYIYLNALAIALSPQPMLALRLFKVTLFMGALIYLARYWRQCYGERLACLGFLYLSLGYWEHFFFNFRNLKDGVIASLVFLIFVSTERLLSTDTGQLRTKSTKMPALRWLPVVVFVLILVPFRTYLAILMVISICVALAARRWRITLQRFLAILVAPVGIGLLYMLFIDNRGFEFLERRINLLTTGGYYPYLKKFAKSTVSPLPWQHNWPYLAPSHCLYLLFFPIVIYSCVKTFHRKMWWQVFFVVLMIACNTILINDVWRKRVPMIPFFVTWVLSERWAHMQRMRKRKRQRQHSKMVP